MYAQSESTKKEDSRTISNSFYSE